MTSDRGKIRASTEPMTDCFFYIYKPSFRIFISFTKFDFPSNDSNNTCTQNYLEIMVGRDHVSFLKCIYK